MSFLTWHYSFGINYYLESWLSFFDWINHQFNFGLLLRSLFSPWKRLVEEDSAPGFDFSRFFRVLTFNLISRGVGAVVRVILILTGFFAMILAFFGGLFGLGLWLIIPLFSLPVYFKYRRQPGIFMKDLIYEIKSTNSNPLSVVFASDAGRFLSLHTGVDAAEFVSGAKSANIDFSKVHFDLFSDVVNFLLDQKVWSSEFFRRNKIEKKDLVYAAKWWDGKRAGDTVLSKPKYEGAGLASDLLFGYTPVLSQYSVNMSVRQEFAHHLIGREEVVARIERTLSSGSSVVLVGEPGVGKKTVVYEFAHRASVGQFGSEMAYRKVLEFDYNAILSQASDLNQKKTILAQVLDEAAYAGNIILMIRDIHKVTNAEVEGYDFTEVFEEHLERRNLKLIVVATPIEYERFVVPNLRLRKYLEKIEITPPSKEDAMEILLEAAREWEDKAAVIIRVNTLRKILEESDRYITDTPFPEKAIELLDAVVSYLQQQGEKVATVDIANMVLAEKTGVSFTQLTQSENKKLADLENIIHKRLIDQDAAVQLIAKSLRARMLVVSKDKRPIGSFLFLGPTGVGKTETAKVLAEVYYGSEESILRFDMAEYAGEEGLERLIGSVSKNLPGALTTAIKNRPASLLLLDEIEKASPSIFNLFLTLLDEGFITDAFGKTVNCRHLFVIGTSNAGAEYIRQLVTANLRGEDLQKQVLDHVLKQGLFSPEFINRFDGVVVYEPLGTAELVKIGQLMLSDLAKDLKSKGVKLVVREDLAIKLAEDGYDPAFGARPMRRIVNLELGDLIGRAMLAGEVKEGDNIEIVPGVGQKQYSIRKV